MVVLYSLIRQVYVSSIKHYSEQRFFILLYYLLPGELRDFQLALAKTVAPLGIDFDAKLKKIYWFDMSMIYSIAPLWFPSAEKLWLVLILNIAFEDEGNNIYWIASY